MPKKNKPVRVKLIANPGAGNVKEATLKIEQVTCYLIDAGLKVDVALAKPKKEAIPIARKAIKDGYDAEKTQAEKAARELPEPVSPVSN